MYYNLYEIEIDILSPMYGDTGERRPVLRKGKKGLKYSSTSLNNNQTLLVNIPLVGFK